ncbi:MAG: LysR family transcriptional regulator [Planctomycetes bacterium]|nr:LysR family transcriptional regulator [Planctomycetota bacterium]
MVKYTLRQLAYFVAAAERASIAEAARVLNVSQPSVSSAITKLEDIFGVQLLLRHHAQGVTPTHAGETLLEEARRLLTHADELGEHALDLGENIRGRLEVGCLLTMSALCMPSLIMAFAREFPSVDIHLFEGHREALVHGLETGRLDVALVYDIDTGPQYEVQPLASLRPYALLPAGHPLTTKAQVTLAELAAEPMVLLDIPPSRDYLVGMFRSAGLTPLMRHESPSFETVRGMVANGAGYSVLVIRPSSDVAYDGMPIEVRPIADDVQPVRIALLRLARLRPTRLSRTFSSFCGPFFANRFPH